MGCKKTGKDTRLNQHVSIGGETGGFHFSISKTDKAKACKQVFKRPQDRITSCAGTWEL